MEFYGFDYFVILFVIMEMLKLVVLVIKDIGKCFDVYCKFLIIILFLYLVL